MNIDINTKIEHWILKAELFLKEDKKVFIKTINGAYHSGDIILVGKKDLLIYDFIKKEKFCLYWIDIILFEEYKEKEIGK